MVELWLILIAFASHGAKAGGLDDFSNNLATDLAPLLTLFGENMTKQYLSESTHWLDYIIFALAPIGILTATASVIRVCGSSSLRAFIGRAREGAGTIESELCSSTSRDVCELFNNGGITRVLAPPKFWNLCTFEGQTTFGYFGITSAIFRRPQNGRKSSRTCHPKRLPQVQIFHLT